jgi:ribosomal protein S18 acetylase RimI-like enzyme
MQNIDIRPTNEFPEPEFSRLQTLVFADVQQYSDELEAILRDEAGGADVSPEKLSPIFRIGAYEGNELVGWSYGWMERGRIFYMGNSGVLPSHRRRGIYTSLLNAVREHVFAEGARVMRSHHSVLNNPVIIAKLRAGFNVSGLTQSAKMGTLVELTLHMTEKRQEMFRNRVMHYAAREA